MVKKFFKTLIGLLLLPVAFAAARAFYFQIASISLYSGVLHIMERGVLVYLIMHVVVARPVYLYVLGHELVHVLATWMCGGKIVSFNVTPSGGNVVTSKTNFFIELSPYFVPFYTILLGIAYSVYNASGGISPRLSAIFVFLVGVTVAFHFAMTSEVIRLKQPDIMKSGFMFSSALILIANLVIIIAVFSPIFASVSLGEFIRSLVAGSEEMYRMAYNKLLGVWQYGTNLVQ